MRCLAASFDNAARLAAEENSMDESDCELMSDEQVQRHSEQPLQPVAVEPMPQQGEEPQSAVVLEALPAPQPSTAMSAAPLPECVGIRNTLLGRQDRDLYEGVNIRCNALAAEIRTELQGERGERQRESKMKNSIHDLAEEMNKLETHEPQTLGPPRAHAPADL